MKPRVLCMQSDRAHVALLAPLEEVAEVDVLPADQTLMEQRLPDYDAFLIELGLQLRGDLVRRCPRLRVVATSTTGTDHIDVGALEAAGVRLISLKNDTEFLAEVSCTAEIAWALMLAVVRNLPAAFDSVKRGEWRRERFRGRQLRGITFGILGFGRLGRTIKDFALGFHMRVLAHDVRDFDPAGTGVEKVDLDTLLARSDVLSIHIHLTDENHHFMGRERIAKMKPGTVLINTSRGAAVDGPALIEALESGHLAGAGVDVLEGEWAGDLTDHPMVRYARTHDNLIISPHLGGATFEAQAMTLSHTVGKLAEALR